jgi:AsmA protein
VNADLQDFEDLLYKIRAKGVLNVGRIYKVFKKEGLDISGLIMADLSLNGRQSYATTGQYSKLDNRGNLILKYQSYNRISSEIILYQRREFRIRK